MYKSLVSKFITNVQWIQDLPIEHLCVYWFHKIKTLFARIMNNGTYASPCDSPCVKNSFRKHRKTLHIRRQHIHKWLGFPIKNWLTDFMLTKIQLFLKVYDTLDSIDVNFWNTSFIMFFFMTKWCFLNSLLIFH